MADDDDPHQAFKSWRDMMGSGEVEPLRARLAGFDGWLPRGPGGESLLHSATSYHHAENRAAMVKMLLEAGLKVDARDDGGRTPLHWAAGYGCAECIPVLLAAGADVHAQRNGGAEPLHQATESTIDLLLAAGADPLATDKRRRFALHTSRAKHKALLAPGVDARDGDSLTPLHHAAVAGDEEWTRWLLDQGADPALETTQVYDLNEDKPDDPWNVVKDSFEAGKRAYDFAKWGHDRTKWNTGQYARVVDMLDKVTPRRGWFRR